ncbi:hypothetical protein [Rhodobaculum claviforme]|uniref:Uncharacterized protein n=1 Tax=Rhodobaculum claviforme TaxID=1549854 RepID=A0A934WJJ9_9RHOB|nr:hypothetical protein [Rhodobaculum claviforme]MBK5928022.1 hypothetical protein [Rhodobaculum claviforme]
MTARLTDGLRSAVKTLRRDGPVGLVARTRLREPGAYEDWCEERDVIAIIATLRRLSERQLERIGMSHATLALDVEDLVARAIREREITGEVLRVVDTAPQRMMAAE